MKNLDAFRRNDLLALVLNCLASLRRSADFSPPYRFRGGMRSCRPTLLVLSFHFSFNDLRLGIRLDALVGHAHFKQIEIHEACR